MKITNKTKVSEKRKNDVIETSREYYENNKSTHKQITLLNYYKRKLGNPILIDEIVEKDGYEIGLIKVKQLVLEEKLKSILEKR